jgi:hypothetical protein
MEPYVVLSKLLGSFIAFLRHGHERRFDISGILSSNSIHHPPIQSNPIETMD